MSKGRNGRSRRRCDARVKGRGVRGRGGASRSGILQVEMSWMSFNLGDVFLVDIGKTLIQWNGPKSNRQERLKVRGAGVEVLS